MSLCTKGAEAILKLIVGEGSTNQYAPQTRYLGLSSRAPKENGEDYLEPDKPSYARIKIGASGHSGEDSANFFVSVKDTKDSNNDITEWYIDNEREIHFNEALENWGNLTHFIITDSPYRGEGNVYFAGQLVSAINVTANSVPLARKGSIKISIPTQYYSK